MASSPRPVVQRSEAPDLEDAQASRPEGLTQDSSRLWKVGVIFAVALGFVMDPATRTRMIGVYGAFVGAAAGSGPFIGGFIVHELGWRSIFYLNLPIGV